MHRLLAPHSQHDRLPNRRLIAYAFVCPSGFDPRWPTDDAHVELISAVLGVDGFKVAASVLQANAISKESARTGKRDNPYATPRGVCSGPRLPLTRLSPSCLGHPRPDLPRYAPSPLPCANAIGH